VYVLGVALTILSYQASQFSVVPVVDTFVQTSIVPVAERLDHVSAVVFVVTFVQTSAPEAVVILDQLSAVLSDTIVQPSVAVMNDNVVVNNILLGNGDDNNNGIAITRSSGTLDKTDILYNHVLDTTTAIRDHTATNTHMIGNRLSGNTADYGGTAGVGQMIRLPGGGSNIVTLANDATPTVLNVALALTGGTTTITDFDDGVLGQTFTLKSDHAITITDGTNILLNGSADFVMAAGDTLTLSMVNDQVWEETARKVNL